MRAVLGVVLLLAATSSALAQEAPSIELSRVRLYQPEEALKERLGADVTPLANYMKAVEKEAAAFWSMAKSENADGLLVVVGVKPNKQARVWCEAVGGKIPPETLAKLEKQLAKVPAIAVKEKPVAFALEMSFRGKQPAEFPALPKAWSDAAKKATTPLLIPDDLFREIWPD